ncbi:hypothetical protein L7F22_061270 [Adiantum nelumboides]|nr:hypothetical protein [Adiantum nelumboides]
MNSGCLQVVSVTSVKGGEAVNVIPDEVTIKGTFRSTAQEGRKKLKQRIQEVIEKQAAVLGCEGFIDFDEPTMGGEDFAFYLEKIPGAMFFLGVGSESSTVKQMFHSPYFSLNEDTLPIGAAMNAAIAELFFKSSSSSVPRHKAEQFQCQGDKQ